MTAAPDRRHRLPFVPKSGTEREALRLAEILENAIAAEFRVTGDPIPQGSLRAFARKGGHPIVTSDNLRTRPWKDAVTWAASEVRRFTATEPVRVDLSFTLRRPKGHSRKAGLLRSAPTYPGKKPDLDKLVRAVLDSLVEAQVIADDALVVMVRASKLYPLYDGEPAGVSVKVSVV